MSASISSSHGSGRCRARRWTSSDTGVPCRLQPRNGTALRRTLVSRTAPWSRSSARSPSPSASASCAWATSARPRTAGCGSTGPRVASAKRAGRGAPVAGEVGAQAGDEGGLGGRADLRELAPASWPSRAPSPDRLARNARSSSRATARWAGSGGVSSGTSSASSAEDTEPWASSSRDRRVRIQKRVVRSAAWPGSGVAPRAPATPTSQRQPAELGELAGEPGPADGVRRDEPALRDQRERLVGDLGRRRVSRPRMYSVNARWESATTREQREVVGAAEPDGGGEVLLGGGQVAGPVLGDGQLAQQDRYDGGRGGA